MKINFKEHENMVEQLNSYVFRWLYRLLSIIIFIISFITSYLEENDIIINIITSVIVTLIIYKVFKYALNKGAKRANRTNKFIELESIIYDDYIEEIVVLENDVKTTSKYYFKDFLKVREDKYNFYLFLINNGAVIINKQKLENIEVFRKQIQDKCVMIKK